MVCQRGRVGRSFCYVTVGLRVGGLCGVFNRRPRQTFGCVRRKLSGRRVLRGAKLSLNMGSTDLTVRRNRVFIVVKLSNSNGSAVMHLLGHLVRPAHKRILVSNISVTGVSSTRLHRIHEGGVTVIFRSFTLVPRVAILSGATFNVRLTKVGTRRHQRGTLSTLHRIKLRGCTRDCPSRLSNKVHRHIKLTHTLTVGPSVLLVSRTFSTLSPLVHARVRSRLMGLRTGRRHAVIFVSRSLSRTVHVNSQVTVVRGNRIMRINAPSRVLGGPTGSCIHAFFHNISVDRMFDTGSVTHQAPGNLVHGAPNFNPHSTLGLLRSRSHRCNCIVRHNGGFINTISVSSLGATLARRRNLSTTLVSTPLTISTRAPLDRLLSRIKRTPYTIPIISRSRRCINVVSGKVLLHTLSHRKMGGN